MPIEMKKPKRNHISCKMITFVILDIPQESTYGSINLFSMISRHLLFDLNDIELSVLLSLKKVLL